MVTDTLYRSLTPYDGGRSLTKNISAGIITEDDKALILEYTDFKSTADGNGERRIQKLIITLAGWRRFIAVPYRTMTTTDMRAGVASLKNGINAKGTPFKPNAVHDHIKILRQFIQWMIREGYSTIPEQKVKEIRTPPVESGTTRPDEIITSEEVKAILTHCSYIRDKALVATLYESGCRIGELSRLTWRDAIFDEHGVKLYLTDTKTSKRRYARLTMATEFLAQYRNERGDPDPGSLIFLSIRGDEPISYRMVTHCLTQAARDAGITKKIKPHLFRKSRITHLIEQNYQESVIKQTMWNNLNTKMFQTYVCLGEDSIDDEFLGKAGIKQKKTSQEDPMAPHPCGRCHYVNPPTGTYCSKCGMALTEEAAAKIGDITIDIETDPRFKDAVQRVLMEMGITTQSRSQ